MKSNIFFAVMMMGMMSMVSVSSFAQGRAMGGGRQMGSSQMSGRSMGNSQMSGRSMGNSQMSGRSMGSQMSNNRGNYGGCSGNIGGGRGGCGGGRGYYREMCGHRWDRDGWMEGWHGRVRCCGDGRWGYYRNGGWLYYDCFYEPDFYYGHPVDYFAPHIYVGGPAVCVGGPVYGGPAGHVAGSAVVGGLIGTAIGAIIGAATY